MIEIKDGRGLFYQWDIDRYVTVEDETIKEIHFCNRTGPCSLVVEVKDGVAPVPNILLQNDYPIKAYACCADGYTKMEATFEVKTRSKPADYVYTETEVRDYDSLEARMTEIEQHGVPEEAVANAINKYFEENPIEVPSKVSELENDADFATKAEVEEAVANVKVDLTGYATEEYVGEAIGELDIPTDEHINELIGEATGALDIPTDEHIGELIAEATGALDIPTDEHIGELIAEATGALDIPTDEHIGELIAEATGALDIPTDEHINSLINNALGVIENGAY